MKKLHYGPELFNMDGMPDWVKAIAVDDNGNIVLCKYIPEIVCGTAWSIKSFSGLLSLEHDYEGDWKDSLLIRPEKIKIGDFCKFWDTNEEPENMSGNAYYGYVTKCTCGFDTHSNWFSNARKFDPSKEKIN